MEFLKDDNNNFLAKCSVNCDNTTKEGTSKKEISEEEKGYETDTSDNDTSDSDTSDNYASDVGYTPQYNVFKTYNNNSFVSRSEASKVAMKVLSFL